MLGILISDNELKILWSGRVIKVTLPDHLIMITMLLLIYLS